MLKSKLNCLSEKIAACFVFSPDHSTGFGHDEFDTLLLDHSGSPILNDNYGASAPLFCNEGKNDN